MNLILEIISTPSHSIFEKTVRFDQNGGKIGRNKHMDWVLHDPTKRISNFHAEIIFKNNQYYIRDKSSNGTFFKDPHKRLTKDSDIPLTNTSIIVIGAYEISAKIVKNEFVGQNNIEKDQIGISESFGIPDEFFMGNSTEKAYNVINPDADKGDILSLINNDSTSSNDILPEFDNIIENHDSPYMEHVENTLNVHIENPVYEEEPIPSPVPAQSTQAIHQVVGDDKFFTLLATKLGLNSNAMNEEEKEALIVEIAELTRVTVEQSQTALQSLRTIKSYLGQNMDGQMNPLLTATSSKEIFATMHKFGQPLSYHIKNLFHELNTHNVAFYTAYTNMKLRDAAQFSPQKLYFSFERDNLLSKTLANKKALAWDAYYDKFKYLDIIKNTEDVDTTELENEYKSVLKTLNLGHKQ